MQQYKIKDFFNDLLQAFDVEKGLLRNIWWMLVRPGKMIHTYLDGDRGRFTNPVKWMVLTATLSYFVSNYFLPDFINLTVNINGTHEKSNQILKTVYTFFTDFQAYILAFVYVPIAALFQTLFYKKQGYNYAKNLVFHYFVIGQVNVLSMFAIPLAYFFADEKDVKELSKYFMFAILIIYSIIVCYRFYGGKFRPSVLKSLFILGISNVLFLIVSTGLIVGGTVLVYYYFS